MFEKQSEFLERLNATIYGILSVVFFLKMPVNSLDRDSANEDSHIFQNR